MLNQNCLGSPAVYAILARWATHKAQQAYPGMTFKGTRISINRDYAAKPHRDSRNEGPSIATALGDFNDGQLQYWYRDLGSGPTGHALRTASQTAELYVLC